MGSTIPEEIRAAMGAPGETIPVARGRKLKNGTIIDGKVFVAKNPPRHVDNPNPVKGNKKKGAKFRHRAALLAYLSNPTNTWPERRQDYLKILGLKALPAYLYQIFTVEEMAEFETEALRIRRSYYAGKHLLVDEALFKNIEENGKAPECRLWYERHEGWKPGMTHEITGANGGPILTMPAEMKTMNEWENFINNMVDVTPKEPDGSTLNPATGATDNGCNLPG